MRGRPRPDIQLAFLQPDQVAQRLEELEGGEDEQYPGAMEEDEDGVDIECLRDAVGEREGDLDDADRVVDDGTIFYHSDSDSPTLSDYEGRRRL